VKNISSQPGAGIFRNNLAIIVILVCIAAFFTTIENISSKVENVSRDRVLADLKYSLSMALYDYTIKGRQKELSKFHEENPFVLQAIYRVLPTNYHGAFKELPESASSGWYFDLNKKLTIYIDSDGDMAEYRMIYAKKGEELKTLEVIPIINSQ